MGATADFGMVSAALAAGSTDEFIDQLFGGIFEQAERCAISIVGGDTSSSPGPLFIDTIVIGKCPAGRAICRSGASPGDLIFVTGSLGGSGLGLTLLEKGHRLQEESDASPASLARGEAILRHLAPEPRMAAGEEIGKQALATAMIDISDGLSTDLGHVLEESGCGAVIHADSIPIADCVKTLAASEPEIDPISLALVRGEEYELLFTARPEAHSRLRELASKLALPITPIGEISSDAGMRLEKGGREVSIPGSGFQHTF